MPGRKASRTPSIDARPLDRATASASDPCKRQRLGVRVSDLLPSGRTSVMAAKSVNLENDGHEKEQIHRRADHRFHQTGRGRLGRKGVVPQGRLQRRHDLFTEAVEKPNSTNRKP